MAASLRFENVTRRFGSFTAVDDVTLDIEPGETFSLLGPSGCGKTTLLRLAAGFERPDRGRVLLDGRDITALPPERRPVNTIFQNYALFPHLSVRENIAFGPKTAKHAPDAVARAVDEMLELVDLKAHADRKPAQLSGGMKQRVAIARALVNRPRVLLLDEPLAALDLKLRQRLLAELKAIHDEVGITFLYVTHDQGEAMSISDRIAVMNHGVVQQVGPPSTVYRTPRNAFVAAFIGDTNFLGGRVAESIDRHHSRGVIDGLGTFILHHDGALLPGDRFHLSIRPEKLLLCRERPEQAPLANAVAGRVEDVVFYGSHTRCRVRCGDWRLDAEIRHRSSRPDEPTPRRGDNVWLMWDAGDGFLLEHCRDEEQGLATLPEE